MGDPITVNAAWVRKNWPTIAVIICFISTIVALSIGWSALEGVKDQQKTNDEQTSSIQQASIGNRRLSCAITRAVTANPLVRYPQFETEKAFERRVQVYRLIVSLSVGYDCKAILSAVTVGVVKPRAHPPGQGSQPGPIPPGPENTTSTTGQVAPPSPPTPTAHAPNRPNPTPPAPEPAPTPAPTPPQPAHICILKICLT